MAEEPKRRLPGHSNTESSRHCCSQDAELNPVTLIQTGGDAVPWEELSRTEGWTFGLPYEVSFVVNITVDVEGRPRGCGALDHTPLVFGGEQTRLPYGEKHAIYVGSPGFDGSPACGANMNAPEGEASADIVASFADDHDLWAEAFLEGWAKLQANGYSAGQLSDGPTNSWLLNWMTPLNPATTLSPLVNLGTSSAGCSEDGSVLDPAKFYLQNVRDSRVISVDPITDSTFMANVLEGDTSQLWQHGLLCSGEISLVNVATGKVLSSWTYNPTNKLLRSGDGRWARSLKKSTSLGLWASVRWIKDEEGNVTEQPWAWFQWDVVRN